MPTIGFASQPSQACVHHPQRKFDPSCDEPVRRVGKLGRGRLGERVPPAVSVRGAGRERHGDDDREGHESQAPDERGRRQLVARERGGDRGIRDEHDAEHEPVANTRGVRLPVARDPREGEGDRQRADRGEPGGEQRRERLEPGLREDHPERDHDDRDEDAAAREGEPDHDEPAVDEQRPGRSPAGREAEAHRQRDVAEQRERVPVADRRAQARDLPVPLVEPREHLPGERPDADDAEQAREAEEQPADVTREVRADEGEPDVEERAVRVVPAPVGLDRPGDRERAPGRERDERREDHRAVGRALGCEQHPDENERCDPQPRQRSRPWIAGEEDRGSRQEEGREKRRPEFASQPHPIRR